MTVISWNREDQTVIVEEILLEFWKSRPVILPTDTIYGIAAPVSSPGTLEAVFKIKNRPKELTLPVAVGALYMVDEIARVHRWQKTTLRDNLPGPVTFVLEAKEDLDPLVVRKGTIAVRVPRHPVFIPLCAEAGPLGLTSANLHGSENIITAEELDDQFRGDLLIIGDNDSISGSPSAIIDLTDRNIRMLREGKVNIHDIMGETNGR
ncbi:MAG: L-threonylcarbamoyladenylate synthase [Thermoplasmatota archaeon]